MTVMQQVKFFAKGVWVDKHLAQWITIIMVMIHVGLGTSIITGGLPRFTSPSYTSLVDFTSGNVWIWGIWIMASSILMSAPFRCVNIIGLWVAMLWHFTWMSAFTIAALHYPTAAVTPIPIYGGMAMICTALLTARVIDKSED